MLAALQEGNDRGLAYLSDLPLPLSSLCSLQATRHILLEAVDRSCEMMYPIKPTVG